ncbi:MAG TPA: 50S ribosomal protein L4 [Phycisphaerae bacterium]|nr:50S ribosomal protein L4 [Phycisphaerales bacterium]HRX86434.1 50S ribosomal protein L4 [Phycisphaerae bacterium]
MIDVPVYNMEGQQSGSVQIDPVLLGGEVRPRLLKQAVVMYQANLRQNTSATKSRGMVAGSTRKLYRQKGTGNARMGNIRTNVRRGGGVAFAKGAQNYSQVLPKKMRRLARNNAILAKLLSGDVAVVDGLQFEKPRTRLFATMMRAIGADRGCTVALEGDDRAVYLSGRNIPRTEVKPVRELNAYDVLRRKKLLFTRAAFDCLVKDPVLLSGGAE